MDTKPLLDRALLVLHQHPKVLEFYNEYDPLDEHGSSIGAVTETRPAALRHGSDWAVTSRYCCP